MGIFMAIHDTYGVYGNNTEGRFEGCLLCCKHTEYTNRHRVLSADAESVSSTRYAFVLLCMEYGCWNNGTRDMENSLEGWRSAWSVIRWTP